MERTSWDNFKYSTFTLRKNKLSIRDKDFNSSKKDAQSLTILSLIPNDFIHLIEFVILITPYLIEFVFVFLTFFINKIFSFSSKSHLKIANNS